MRVFYTGDWANEPGQGEHDGTTVTLDDGRVFRDVHATHLKPSPGRRFMPWTEYQEDREKKLAALRQAAASRRQDTK